MDSNQQQVLHDREEGELQFQQAPPDIQQDLAFRVQQQIPPVLDAEGGQQHVLHNIPQPVVVNDPRVQGELFNQDLAVDAGLANDAAINRRPGIPRQRWEPYQDQFADIIRQNQANFGHRVARDGFGHVQRIQNNFQGQARAGGLSLQDVLDGSRNAPHIGRVSGFSDTHTQ